MSSELSSSALHILTALADQDRHGYAIMKEVARMTGGRTRLGPGTLYGTLKRLLRDGLVMELPPAPAPDVGHRRRRAYRLTPAGRERLRVEIERLAGLTRVAAARLRGSPA